LTGSERDKHYMFFAVEQAKKAGMAGEVPIGAVIVRGDEVIASAHNRCEATGDPTAHAEILAIQAAAKKIGKNALSDCELYVTVEPCAMCAGAIVNSNLKKAVFGAHESRTGCMGSVIDISEGYFINSVATYGGVLESECAALMQGFFEDKR
jgi:tRNA(adenine34) deaminase